MNCGQCIRNGYNFCYKGSDFSHWSLNSHNADPSCCEDDTCAKASDSDYSCSSTFTDQVYALTMCPQRQKTCGKIQEISFDEAGQSIDVTVKGLDIGETCTYVVKAKCGSPGFSLLTEDGINSGAVSITFMEYSSGAIPEVDASTMNTEVHVRQTEAPRHGWPPRNMKFGYSGK